MVEEAAKSADGGGKQGLGKSWRMHPNPAVVQQFLLFKPLFVETPAKVHYFHRLLSFIH
ncbi:hypothetical protein NDS46_19750 [Paenibacillus thiaminolyticus]|uniref:hypothetical protein n=1 Tax=Paenibacillus thiaminolyticus TaxID=49283 RepID=UPI00232E372B|nr:hypothetical protein [Paenibacillus thiaminolyticus]WCF06577.1 hypothetical protein NDS46_19750 [Paenibacillus thiaminolyticus]